MNTELAKPGARVRYISGADELAAKGNDLSHARGLTGVIVPIEGDVLRELDEIERAAGKFLRNAPPRDQLVAVLRDDAAPGHRYQFATAADLLPEAPDG